MLSQNILTLIQVHKEFFIMNKKKFSCSGYVKKLPQTPKHSSH